MSPHWPELLKGPIDRVRMELLATRVDDAGFLEQVRGLAELPCSAVLLSGGDLDCSRHSLAAWDPGAAARPFHPSASRPG
jgi:para-aminobenzoate synthetase component 1